MSNWRPFFKPWLVSSHTHAIFGKLWKTCWNCNILLSMSITRNYKALPESLQSRPLKSHSFNMLRVFQVDSLRHPACSQLTSTGRGCRVPPPPVQYSTGSAALPRPPPLPLFFARKVNGSRLARKTSRNVRGSPSFCTTIDRGIWVL
jgi:hypothetical protein